MCQAMLQSYLLKRSINTVQTALYRNIIIAIACQLQHKLNKFSYGVAIQPQTLIYIHCIRIYCSSQLSTCMYILFSPFFTRVPSRHGPSVTIKLLVVCPASILLMISIYLTIILVSSRQGILMSSLERNSQATRVYSTHLFYLVAEPYRIT